MGRRGMAWGFITVSILMLGGLFFGFMPYLDISYFINRKTGQIFKVTSYYGILKERAEETDLFSRGGELNGRIPMTAADTEVFINNIALRFPWSEMGDGTGEINQHGDKLLTAFSVLFLFDSEERLPDELWNRIIIERIGVWNSNETDEDPDAVITRFRNENEKRAEFMNKMRFSGGKP